MGPSLMNITAFRNDHARLGGNVIGGDPRTSYPQLWDWLVQRFAVKTVVDVGAAEGHALAYFQSLGCLAVGIEGHPINAMIAGEIAPTICHDIEAGPCVIRGIDLVICIEVAEHINEAHVGNLMDTLCQGRVVAFTHALPGQGGHHHVNEKPASYWVNHFRARSYTLNEIATNRARELAHHFFAWTGLIFERSL